MRTWIGVGIVLLAMPASAARLKDLAQLRGVRNNQLLGYGIVVGLSGTGDKTSELTEGSLGLALKGLGVETKARKLDTQNTAAVVVSAVLPPFARAGSRIDVTISSIGSASSLTGGTLLMTPLRGPDGKVYAMAQGNVITVRKSDGQNSAVIPLTTAEIIAGALIEKEISLDFSSQHTLKFQLRDPDFTTAARVARRIDEELGGKYATPVDAATVEVIPPYGYEGSTVDLIAQLEGIDVEADSVAKVVINSHTGTVVLGGHVHVAPVAISHRNLKLEVGEGSRKVAGEAPPAPKAPDAAVIAGSLSAGDPFTSGGKPKTVAKRIAFMNAATGANIGDIVDALNQMGFTSDDLIDIIQALRASGALVADVEVR